MFGCFIRDDLIVIVREMTGRKNCTSNPLYNSQVSTMAYLPKKDLLREIERGSKREIMVFGSH